MKPADPVIIPGKLKRAMEASSYAANVLSALNEASYFLDIIESEYPEMFDESEIQDHAGQQREVPSGDAGEKEPSKPRKVEDLLYYETSSQYI